MKNVKTVFSILGILLLSIIWIKPALPEVPRLAPNLVTCTNIVASSNDQLDSIKLIYRISDFTPRPSILEYSRLTDGGRSIKVTERGNSIDIQDTVLGSLVSVQDPESAEPDRSTSSITLVLPTIQLSKKLKSLELNTVIVETETFTSFAGPQLVTGAIQKSNFFPVKCTVQRVNVRGRNR